MAEKKKRRWTIPILLPQSRKGRSVSGRNCSLRSGLLALALLPVFDTTSPGKGGGWNRAGARHGGFTPPRISRSCVQEYHCKLTGSWRSSLPRLHLTWVGIALHLIWPSFDAEMLRTGGLRAPGLTLAPSAKVFQSPDMTAWAVFFKVQRDHEKDPLMW